MKKILVTALLVNCLLLASASDFVTYYPQCLKYSESNSVTTLTTNTSVSDTEYAATMTLAASSTCTLIVEGNGQAKVQWGIGVSTYYSNYVGVACSQFVIKTANSDTWYGPSSDRTTCYTEFNITNSKTSTESIVIFVQLGG